MFWYCALFKNNNVVCMQQSERETAAGAGVWGSVFVAVFIRVKGSVTIWKPFMDKLAGSQYCRFALLTFWLVSSPSTAAETWETFAANHVKSRCNKSGCSGLVPTGKCGDGGRNSYFSGGVWEYLLHSALPRPSKTPVRNSDCTPFGKSQISNCF